MKFVVQDHYPVRIHHKVRFLYEHVISDRNLCVVYRGLYTVSRLKAVLPYWTVFASQTSFPTRMDINFRCPSEDPASFLQQYKKKVRDR